MATLRNRKVLAGKQGNRMERGKVCVISLRFESDWFTILSSSTNHKAK